MGGAASAKRLWCAYIVLPSSIPPQSASVHHTVPALTFVTTDPILPQPQTNASQTYRAAQQVRGFSVGYYIFPPRLTDAYLYGKKFGRGKAGSGPGRGSGSGGRLRGGADTSGGQSDEGKTREGNTREGKAREGKRGFWGRWWR